MNDNQNYQEVKTYTQKLLAITQFSNHQARIRYQQRLGHVRQHLVKWNKKLDGVNLYQVRDPQEIARRTEAGQLIKAVNSRLLRLSV